MSDHAHAPSPDRSSVTGTSVPATPTRSPADLARDAVFGASQAVAAVRHARAAVVDAAAANDRAAWTTARERLTTATTQARRDTARATALLANAPDAAPATVGVQRDLDELEREATTDVAPKGYSEVSYEAELLAAVARRPEGSARDGYQRKEEAIKGWLDRLDALESRMLANRIAKRVPGDELAAAFLNAGNLGTDRRARILAFMAGARERAARRAEPARRAELASPTVRSDVDPSRGGAQETNTLAPTSEREDVRVAHVANVPRAADSYFGLHARAFLATARARLMTDRIATGAARLTWAHGLAAFVDQLDAAIEAIAGSVTTAYTVLAELLHPADPWRVIDENRRLTEGEPGTGKGPQGWSPAAGVALAGAFEAVIESSLARMAPRYVDATDNSPTEAVTADVLVTSHPFDRVTARMLCAPGVAHVARDPRATTARAATGPASHDLQRDGLRLVYGYEWLGARDPQLWNWIKVTDPIDATPEEVALLLWPSDGERSTYRAYGITGTAPFFAIQPAWAREIPGAQEHAPVLLQMPWPMPTRERSPAATLASSTLADEAALAQATRSPGAPTTRTDRADALEALDSSAAILGDLSARFGTWGMAHAVAPALGFVELKRGWFATASREDAARWQETMVLVGACVRDVGQGATRALDTIGAPSPEASGGDPRHRVLRTFAEALGASHLVDSARHLLGTAMQELALLPFDLLQASGAAARRSLDNLDAAESGGALDILDQERRLAPELEEQWAHSNLVQAELRQRRLAGKAIDPLELEDASLDMREVALRGQLAQLELALAELSRQAYNVMDGVFGGISSEFDTVLQALPDTAAELWIGVSSVDRSLDPKTHKPADDAVFGAPSDEQSRVEQAARLRGDRRVALAVAPTRLSALYIKHGFTKDFFTNAAATIKDANRRRVVVEVGMLIAITIASAGVGELVGGFAAGLVDGARGVTAATDIAELSGTARVVGGATEMVASAATQAGLTTLTSGEDFSEGFLANLGVSAALKPLHAIAHTWGAMSSESFNMWEKSGRITRLVANASLLTVDLVVGAGVGYVVHQLVGAKGGPPDEQTITDWALQGASMALGSFLHARLGDSLERLRLAGGAAGDLVRRTGQQQLLAAKISLAGDPSAAMELCVAEYQLKREEEALWKRIVESPAEQARWNVRLGVAEYALEHTRAQLADTTGKAGGLVQLRLSGLEPAFEGAREWAGSSEDIAVALDQCKRSGIPVEITGFDPAARVWRITLANEALTVRERGQHGRTRDAKAEVSPEEAKRHQRYAEAARSLQATFEEANRQRVESGDSFVTDYVQCGYAIAGVMNQDTLPEHGADLDIGNRLVVYRDNGAMANRGALRSGQHPDHQTGPGLRTREQTSTRGDFATSQDLGNGIGIGRLEEQMPAYRAEVVALERFSEGVAGWEHPDRRYRLLVKGSDGKVRRIYCNRYDNVGGMGPTNFGPAKALVAGTTADDRERSFASLRAKGRLIGADDPNISSLLVEGEQIFIWGGSPTGSWAGEDAALHGADATIVGESPDVADARAFDARLHEAMRAGDPDLVKRLIEERIAATHKAPSLDRNRAPGAAYQPGGHPRVKIELGVPTSMRALSNGRVEVTVGVGENPSVRVFDRVVMAIGQSPGDPGGPAGLLGPGAPLDASRRVIAGAGVPEGTIGLVPILDGTGRLVGLESEDGSLRLLGAAYATPALARWVIPSRRDEFVRDVNKHAVVGEKSHTGVEMSKLSVGVGPGIEAQRDRIPVANEVLAARSYALPAEAPGGLVLPAGEPERWPDVVADFLTKSMRAGHGRVQVSYLAEGGGGAHRFAVTIGAESVGVVTVYDRMEAVAADAQVRALVEQAGIASIETTEQRGVMAVEGAGSAIALSSVRSDPAKRGTKLERGETFDGLVETWARADSSAKNGSRQRLEAAVERVALSLAEIHNRFAADGGFLSDSAKRDEVHGVYAQLDALARRGMIDDAEMSRIRAAVGTAELEFMSARIPASATLGNASENQFAFKGYEPPASDDAAPKYNKVAISDVAGLGTSTASSSGLADIASFIESLHANPRLEGLVTDLETKFVAAYTAAVRLPAPDVSRARRWYSARELMSGVARGQPGALARLVEVLGGAP